MRPKGRSFQLVSIPEHLLVQNAPKEIHLEFYCFGGAPRGQHPALYDLSRRGSEGGDEDSPPTVPCHGPSPLSTLPWACAARRTLSE